MMGKQDPRFVRGFVRFVIAQGRGALAPAKDGSDKRESWQAVGRRLYGTELFNQTLREEIEALKAPEEKAHAEVGIPAVRGDQGELAERRAASS